MPQRPSCSSNLPNSGTRLPGFRGYPGWNYFAALSISACLGMGSSAQKMDSAPSIRRLTRDEWREYRELRLRALADSPDAFTTTLAQAQARDDADWSSQVARGAHSRSEIALVADSESRLI